MKKITLLVFILIFGSVSLFSETLTSSYNENTITGFSNSSWQTITSVSPSHSANDKILVLASWSNKSVSGTTNSSSNKPEFQLNGNSNTIIERDLITEGDLGIGSNVYIFQPTSANQTFTLETRINNLGGTPLVMDVTANLIAIPLKTNLNVPLVSGSSVLTSTATATTSFTGIADTKFSITANVLGDIYLSASIEGGINGGGQTSDVASGEWKLQYSTDDVTWVDATNPIERSMKDRYDFSAISLCSVLEDMPADTYFFQLSQKENSAAASAHIQTEHCNLVAVSLAHNNSGTPINFEGFKVSGSGGTSSTSYTNIISKSLSNDISGKLFLQSQYQITSTADATSGSMQITSNSGSTQNQPLSRYMRLSTNKGSGTNLAINNHNSGSFTAYQQLKRDAGSGTLNLSNAHLVGFFLSSDDEILPVTLSSFTAAHINNQSTLNWTTQSENQNSGWNVLRNTTPEYNSAAQLNGSIIDGYGTTSEPSNYSFIDETDLEPGQTYWYWLESISYSGASEHFGPIAVEVINQGELEETPAIESTIGLLPNYPNPFNPETMIMFNLADDEVAEYLEIYNMRGQKINSIQHPDNPQSWDGKDSAGNQLASGVYTYILKTNKAQYQRKMVLTK